MYSSLTDLPEDYYLVLLGVQCELARKTEGIEYLLVHQKPGNSYFNIYQSKWRAYLNAIDPRYWSYNTAVFMRPKSKPAQKIDFSSIT